MAAAKYPGSASYIFRTSAKDALQAPFAVNDILKCGWERVAVFADTTGCGDAGLKDVETALASQKLAPVYAARFKLGVTDLSSELNVKRIPVPMAAAQGYDAIYVLV